MIQWETNQISRHCSGRLNLVLKNLCLYFSEWIAFSSMIHRMSWWWPKTVGASWAQLMWLRRRMSKSLMPVFARTQNLSLHLFRMGYQKIWLWVEVQKKNSKKLWGSALMASMNLRRNRSSSPIMITLPLKICATRLLPLLMNLNMKELLQGLFRVQHLALENLNLRINNQCRIRQDRTCKTHKRSKITHFQSYSHQQVSKTELWIQV